ncbi:unnamed protein product [Timema podura]|uniref:Peptidase S8 pro-domain domain-containing protein n=1 Tax=Timema podura TaxID=61482 RepID=A0ABN7NGX0_TIMPD|nr:unnamed protein product [Timema podura]
MVKTQLTVHTMARGLSPSTLPIPARDSVKKLLGSENDAKVLTTNATVVNGVLKEETTPVPTIPTQQPQEKTTTTPTPTIPTPTTPTTTTPTPTTTIPTTTTPTLPTTPTPAGPTNSTVVPHTTPNPTIAPVTSTPPPKNRNFDGPSFVGTFMIIKMGDNQTPSTSAGGIILCMGIIAIAFVAWKFYKARTERNYHTLRLQLFSDGEFYHFQHHDVPSQAERKAYKHLKLLNRDERIPWVQQQKLVTRTKRNFVLKEGKYYVSTGKDDLYEYLMSKKYKDNVSFNDPFYPKQWYLQVIMQPQKGVKYEHLTGCGTSQKGSDKPTSCAPQNSLFGESDDTIIVTSVSSWLLYY